MHKTWRTLSTGPVIPLFLQTLSFHHKVESWLQFICTCSEKMQATLWPTPKRKGQWSLKTQQLSLLWWWTNRWWRVTFISRCLPLYMVGNTLKMCVFLNSKTNFRTFIPWPLDRLERHNELKTRLKLSLCYVPCSKRPACGTEEQSPED